MRLKNRAVFVALLLVIGCLTLSSALAQTRATHFAVRYTLISPLIALLAGILILIIPRVLNFIVAIYLILIGLIGLFGI